MKVLESKREQIRKLWSDQTVPPEYRVSATLAINDETVDRIRALLTEEQKEKYHPLQQRDIRSASQKASLDDWMNATRPK